MSIHPREPKDLLLAPVAVEIDRNLQPLRVCRPHEVQATLEDALEPAEIDHSRAGREALVLEAAREGVEMRGWHAEITGDGTSLRLSGGSVKLDIGLGRNIQDYLIGLS